LIASACPAAIFPWTRKLIATRGYKVDKEGDIKGKGHAKRDIVEWMIPRVALEGDHVAGARPSPTLKGESVLTLRLMG